jgi:hypothetical protein
MKDVRHDYDEDERVEKEENFYEELIKASSNKNILLGLIMGLMILHCLIYTYFAMRGNYGFVEWLQSIVLGKFLIVPIALAILHNVFSDYVNNIRLKIFLIENYKEYIDATLNVQNKISIAKAKRTQIITQTLFLFVYGIYILIQNNQISTYLLYSSIGLLALTICIAFYINNKERMDS